MQAKNVTVNCCLYGAKSDTSKPISFPRGCLLHHQFVAIYRPFSSRFFSGRSDSERDDRSRHLSGWSNAIGVVNERGRQITWPKVDYSLLRWDAQNLYYTCARIMSETLRHAFSNSQTSTGTTPQTLSDFFETDLFGVLFDADHESDVRIWSPG